MTAFEKAVVEVLESLRPGDVVTYGEVAEEAGYPRAARAVGALLRTSDGGLPWWRVVGAGGRLRAPDQHRQATLLAQEGVKVIDGRVADHYQP